MVRSLGFSLEVASKSGLGMMVRLDLLLLNVDFNSDLAPLIEMEWQVDLAAAKVVLQCHFSIE